MLRGAWLACLLAGVPVAAKPVHGDPFSPTPPACPAKEYPKHHKVCDDLQFCRESGKVCLPCGWGPNQTNVAACCYKKDLPLPNARGHYPCEWQSVVMENGTFCKPKCCTTGSVVCGDGCCRTGDHGYPHKCGRTLKLPHQGKGGKNCCIPQGASVAEQEQEGCCVHGQGLNCLHNETPCCLWTEGNMHTADPDPHSPCQRSNCSLFQFDKPHYPPKQIFVSDKMAERPELISDNLLEKGGYFFMCGPAVATPSVQKALKAALVKHGQNAAKHAEKDMWPTPKTDAEAELWFKDFMAAGRYSEESY